MIKITDYTGRYPDFPIEVKEIFPIVKDKYEANYVNVRKKALRGRRIWTMNWSEGNLLNSTQFNSTRTEINLLRGTFFSMKHPYTEEEVTVTIDEFMYSERLYTKEDGVYYTMTIKFMEK